MLLKQNVAEKKGKLASKQRTAASMKLTLGTAPTTRVHRRVGKGAATKRSAVSQQQRLLSAKEQERTAVDPCDNSNDSGLGYDHPPEFSLIARNTFRFTEKETPWMLEHSEAKRKKLEIKLESDNANDKYSFSNTMNCRGKKGTPDTSGLLRTDAQTHTHTGPPVRTESPVSRAHGKFQTRCAQVNVPSRRTTGPVTLTSQLLGASRNGKTHLQILCQPEQQHRARYQTEGSRGAVKDRSGNGFPVIKLEGYDKPTTLQVFIGTDMGRVAPHMFYQACRVSGKNSTPCIEKKMDGTVVIEVNFDPAKNMVITCDCVGILKERNVDVEHRFPEHSAARNKKKSTRCRMVFRTTITHPDGSTEVLQISSQQIVCTQPPGIPEICKKSLTTCPCTGGMELFMFGKNFLKDTRVVFQHTAAESPWEEAVQPDKEFLQQTHLVCVVPPYRHRNITEAVSVRLMVVSSGKMSEAHTFTYTPITTQQQPALASPESLQPCATLVHPAAGPLEVDMSQVFSKTGLVPLASSALPTHLEVKQSTILPPSYLTVDHNQVAEKERNHQAMWHTSTLIGDSLKQEGKHLLDSETSNKSQSVKLMPPPLIPLVSRHCIKSLELKVETEDDNQLSPDDLKGIDLRMKPTATVLPMATVADLSSTQSPSMATLRRFVGEDGASSLPTQSAQSVEKFLSRIENKSGSSEQHKILFSTGPLYSTESSKQSSGETGSTLHSQQKTFTDNSISILPTVTTVNFQTPSEQRNDLSSMHCSSSIIYTSDTPSTSSLVPNTITHNENKLMEDIPKSSEHGNLSVPHMLPSSLIETSVGTGNTTMNIENSTLREHMLAPTPLLSTHASRLETLVSSAIETQVQQQPSSTERLDALVNSAAESHLINTSSLPSVASSTVSINDNLHRQHFSGGLTTETSAMPMNMILDSSASPPSSVAVFQLSNPQNVAQISQENVILNHVVSAAFNDHLLSASSLAQDKHLSSENTDLNNQLSPSNRPGLDSVVITAADHAILQSSSHDSSDAMLTCATATGEDPLLVSAASRTSPIAIKNMILNTAVASLEGDMHIAGPSRTSPIAIKAMLLDSHISAVMAQETSLVQSTLNSHLMTTNVAEPTRGSTLQSMLEDSGNIPTLLSGSTHSQKSPLTITQAPSLPEASHQLNTCITTSILPKEVQHNLQSGQLMYTSQASGEFVPHILVTNIGQKEMVAQCVEDNHQTSIDNRSSHTMGTSTSQDRKTTTNVSSLPVPVADMSTKDVPGSGTVHKKAEEGMVPQELTQMSDNDLLSYINPSCFDQV